MLAMILLVLGIMSRLIVHQPNFTPVMALALFGGMYLPRKTAVIVPVLMMVVSDVLIGMHATVLLTWGGVALIAGLGLWLRERKNVARLLGASMISAWLFFVISNFGAWLVMYPRTLEGLRQCYFLAIPFFRMTLLSTVMYACLFVVVYEALAFLLRQTRFSKILLSS